MLEVPIIIAFFEVPLPVTWIIPEFVRDVPEPAVADSSFSKETAWSLAWIVPELVTTALVVCAKLRPVLVPAVTVPLFVTVVPDVCEISTARSFSDVISPLFIIVFVPVAPLIIVVVPALLSVVSIVPVFVKATSAQVKQRKALISEVIVPALTTVTLVAPSIIIP